MLACIRLEQNMSCEYICQTVQKAIISYTQEHTDIHNALLVINIQKAVDDSSLVPKLELKDIVS
jgi:hypothetical protein